MSKKYTLVALALILVLGGFFRFWLIQDFPPGLYPDEAMNGNNLLEAITTANFKPFYPENNGREGLFINIQALSVWFFGNTPWALRGVSAIFGTLTILSIFLLTKELFRKVDEVSDVALDRGAGMVLPEGKERRDHASSKSTLGILNDHRDTMATTTALLAAFFLATSYWHVNFSRIGFRAIMVPLISSLAFYFLLKGTRTQKISSLVAAGFFVGVGLNTYIAFRFIPFALLIPVGWQLWQWYKGNTNACTPCAIALVFFAALITILPLGIYFANHPSDFFGRASDVAITSAPQPALEFLKSNIATVKMFFVSGDCNWRHNLPCFPELHPLVAFFFAIGLFSLLRALIRKESIQTSITLLGWLGIMSFPATLTREGLPHALRSIGMIAPALIIAAFGASEITHATKTLLERQIRRLPAKAHQIKRVQKELAILFVLLLVLIPLATYDTYFNQWAPSQQTYYAFSSDLLHIGQYLNNLPQDTQKYVIVNMPGVLVRDIPTPAQTVMFATNTFPENERSKKNFIYLSPEAFERSVSELKEKTVIAILNSGDKNLIHAIQKKFPEIKIKVPGDFVLLQNY